MILGNHMVTKNDARPAGPPAECFYCQTRIGGVHRSDCVIRKRSVMVRLTVEYPIEVPEDWDERMVNFHRNESSWCASNLIPELKALHDGGCICPHVSYEYLREATPEDHDECGFRWREERKDTDDAA